MRNFIATVVLCVAQASSAWADPINLNWSSLGGANEFERFAVSFAPVQVNSFVGFRSGGGFQNLVHTEGSGLLAQIFFHIGSDWVLVAEDSGVDGPPGSEFALDGFAMLPVNFSTGPLTGIGVTNSLAGATRYFGMNSGPGGTVFAFDVRAVPEPSLLFLPALFSASMFTRRSKIAFRFVRRR